MPKMPSKNFSAVRFIDSQNQKSKVLIAQSIGKAAQNVSQSIALAADSTQNFYTNISAVMTSLIAKAAAAIAENPEANSPIWEPVIEKFLTYQTTLTTNFDTAMTDINTLLGTVPVSQTKNPSTKTGYQSGNSIDENKI